MKKRLLAAIIALIAIATPSSVYAQVSAEAAGIYNGTLAVSQDGYPMGEPSNENIELVVEDANHVTLQIKNFSFKLGDQSLPLGDIIIPGVELQKEGNTTFLLPTEVKLTLAIVGEVDVHLAKSSIIDKKIVVNLSVDTTFPVELTIDVAFEGTQTGGSGITNTLTEKPTVYYNQATNMLVVKGAANSQFDIYNITGIHIKTGLVTENINISDLSKGIYLIKIGAYTSKFIKK